MSVEETIAEQLGKIVRLLSILVTKDLSQKEQIILLASAGFQPKEIAELIGTTPNTVSVRLAEIRKQRAVRRAGGAPKGGGSG